MAESLGVDVELDVELREVMATAQAEWSTAKCVAVDVGMRRETAAMEGTERVHHMITRYREIAEEAAKTAADAAAKDADGEAVVVGGA